MIKKIVMLDMLTMVSLMRKALLLAVIAKRNDEVPIGALVYSTEYGILGEGYNQTRMNNDPTAHAETIAIRNACTAIENYRLKNCHLITTIEPCFFCLGISLEARICGIVYGSQEPKMGAFTHAIIPKHRQSHIQYVYQGILAEECRAILSAFFQEKRKKNAYHEK